MGYNRISDIGGYPSPDTFSDEIAEAFMDSEFTSYTQNVGVFEFQWS